MTNLPTLRNTSRDLPSGAQGFAVRIIFEKRTAFSLNGKGGGIGKLPLEVARAKRKRLAAIRFEAVKSRVMPEGTANCGFESRPFPPYSTDGYRVAPCEFPGRPSAGCATPLFVHFVRCSN